MTNETYMKRAIRLASRGRTSPNPKAGAVIVKNGEIIGDGYHPKAGMPHAEIYAIEKAGENARGASMYVTLEPCCHFGKTPPCIQAIIESGISEVFIAMIDPDERVAGKGIIELEKAGIKVHYPLLEDDAKELNLEYIKHRTTGMPYVIIKSAMTLDGKIASNSGRSEWVTNEISRKYAHTVRSEVDAIMIGGNTARLDNPRLSARTGIRKFFPTRIIVSSKGYLPLDLEVFNQKGDVIVAVSEKARDEQIRLLESARITVLRLGDDKGGVDFQQLMKELGKLDILTLMIEGGSLVSASALKAKVADKIMFFYAPKIIGGQDSISSIGSLGINSIADCIEVEDIKIKHYHNDVCLEGKIVYRTD